MVSKDIELKIWESNCVTLYAREGEIDSRYIKVSFKTQELKNLDLTGKTVTIYAKKPDGTQIFNTCTINSSDNTITAKLTSQFLSAKGIVECEFQIFEGDTVLLKVSGLKIMVVSVLDFSEAVESTSEYNTLLKSIEQAQDFANKTGDTKNLSTNDKSSIIAAINEVNAKTIPISQGGTGATTAAEALTNIGAAASAHTHSASSITSGTLPISRGGTGATTVSGAKINLGFSTATSLYSNSSGTHSTITLSGDVSNYDAIGIYCFWESQDIYGSRYYEILASSSKTSLYNLRTSNDGNGVVLCGYNITVTSNTITFVSYSNYKSIYITSDNATGSSEFYGRYLTNQIPYITKVVGYNY